MVDESEEYIRKHYGKTYKLGERVVNTETDREGIVAGFNGQYVEVIFDYDLFPTTSHPMSTESVRTSGADKP